MTTLATAPDVRTDQAQRPPISSLLDAFSRWAGLAAIAFALAAALGWLDLAAFLAARRLPVFLAQLDPVSLAVRTPGAAYAVTVVLLLWRGIYASSRGFPWDRLGRLSPVIALALAIVALYVEAAAGQFEWVALLLGVVALIAYLGRPVDLRNHRARLALLLVVLGIFVVVTGYARGLQQSVHPEASPSVTVVTTIALPAIAGRDLADGLHEYSDLYLVYADSRSLFLGSKIERTGTWIVQWAQVRTLSVP